ncbi:hypothetical protein OIU77_002636 [Salix suchowensis]|uniref:Uncharacterized protein n=1 Tax=Salix suchowensis TaxID=1278906 RepID=A0ABQ9AZT5_9ROSI|nr:hypothetical protein OIU77_002636 [Salix suchowensis]
MNSTSTQFVTSGRMGIYDSMHQIGMWGENFKSNGNPSTSTMFIAGNPNASASIIIAPDIKLDNQSEDTSHGTVGHSNKYDQEASKPADKVKSASDAGCGPLPPSLPPSLSPCVCVCVCTRAHVFTSKTKNRNVIIYRFGFLVPLHHVGCLVLLIVMSSFSIEVLLYSCYGFSHHLIEIVKILRLK